MLDTLLTNLKQAGIFQSIPRAHVVVALSGGPDSTALLYLLSQLRDDASLDLDLTITAAYYHHNWRPIPPKELPFLHKHTQACGVQLVMIDAPRNIKKSEAYARDHRYHQILSLARDIKADAVLTAHHADDQVETVLFRVLRGTGVDGLTGIRRRLVFDDFPDTPVIRPLLDTPRQALQDFLQANQLDAFDDPTNLDLKHTRNLIRQKVLPSLMEDFPHAKNALFKLGLLSESESHLIEDHVDPLWKKIHLTDAYGTYLDATQLSQLVDPYQRRIIKRFFLANDISVDFNAIEETMAFVQGEYRHDISTALKSLEQSSTSKQNLSAEDEITQKPSHRFLSIYKGQIRIIEQKDTPPAEAIALNVPGYTYNPDLDVTCIIRPLKKKECRFYRDSWLKKRTSEREQLVNLSEFLPKEKTEPQPPEGHDPSQPWFPIDDTPETPTLWLRSRRAQDRFQPLGMSWSMRLKKFFINQGIPRFERDRIPVIAIDNIILWVSGQQISDAIKVTKTPTHWISIQSGQVLPPEDQSDDDDDDDTDETANATIASMDDSDLNASRHETSSDSTHPNDDDDDDLDLLDDDEDADSTDETSNQHEHHEDPEDDKEVQRLHSSSPFME